MPQPVNSRFRYLDAGDLDNTAIDFDGLDVRNDAGDKLGDVDGFVADSISERPYYVVVDSGGWFSGGRYLVPINHLRLERDAANDEDVLRTSLGRDTIESYPKFDQDEFARLTDSDLRDYEDRLGAACCPDEVTARSTQWRSDRWAHYRQPEWWRPAFLRPSARTEVTPTSPPSPRASRHPSAERIVAQDNDAVGDRAQPGNVLGIKSGGEETHLGDTATDEERRVRLADRESRRAEKNERG